MNCIIDLLVIALICVMIIDISRFPDSIKAGIGKWLKISPESIRLKPFDCSLCSTFWCGLVYLIVTNHLTLIMVAVDLGFACLTTEMASLIWLVKDIITRIINKMS